MTHHLRLTDPTKELILGEVLLQGGYAPQAPQVDHIEQLTLADGGELPVSRRRNVTETARLLLAGIEATTNLVTNPSCEVNIAGWTKHGNYDTSRARSTEQALFGTASLKVTRQAGSGEEGCFATIPVVNGRTYTVSAYALAGTGSPVARLRADGTNVPSTTVALTAGADWARTTLTVTATGTGDMYVRIYSLSGSVGDSFYADGVQVEERAGPTAYCDGEQLACVWAGARHASTSSRVGGIEGARQAVRDIESMLLRAELYQRERRLGRAYVRFAPGGTGDVYRSEILSGRVDLGQHALDLDWWNAQAEVAVIWTRRWYWEGPEAEIPLANAGGITYTGGRVVANHDDSGIGDDNWVDIGTEQVVAGQMPAPIRLLLENATNNADRMNNIYLGHNVYSAPQNLPHIIEAESAAYGAGTNHADAACSGGYRRDNTIPTGDTQLYGWTLGSTLLGQCAGGRFRIIARLTAAVASGSYLYMELRLGTIQVWRGPTVASPLEHMIDFGVVQLPPGLDGLSSPFELILSLYGYRPSGSTSISLDFLQLTPTDSYRRYGNIGYGVPYERRLVDDGIDGRLYVEKNDETERVAICVGYGEPVHLVPGRRQRLYLLHTTLTGTAPISRATQMRVFYRPRRLTL